MYGFKIGDIYSDDVSIYLQENPLNSVSLFPETYDAILDREDIEGIKDQGCTFNPRPINLSCVLIEPNLITHQDKLHLFLHEISGGGLKELILYPYSKRHIKSRVIQKLGVDYTPGYTRLEVPLTCPDPRFYSNDLHSEVFSSLTTITNAGNFETPPIYEIFGSATNPKITINGEIELEYSGVIPSGSKLTIDTRLKTVKFNNVNGNKRFNKVFAPLPPGDNSINISSGTLKVSWRDSWISLTELLEEEKGVIL